MNKKSRIAKRTAGPAHAKGLAALLDMPLAKKRVAASSFVFTEKGAFLSIENLENPIVWGLGIYRPSDVRKEVDPQALADNFAPAGGRYFDALEDVGAELAGDTPPIDGNAATIDGLTEFGLQSADDHEYFLSKFGDLVGILRVQRKADGTWKAGLEKSNVPRVLSKEAVEQGLMPPPGHSGLPKSLEAVVPEEFHFWKAQGEEARKRRDALVEHGFFTDDCVKAVDGELRKVEVRYELYDPATKRAPVVPNLATRVADAVSAVRLGKAYSPMAEAGEDWLEVLDANDADGALAVLSPVDRKKTSAREMARAARTLKADYLLEHNDTRYNRACFRSAGVVFKIAGEPSRVFCTSFVPDGIGRGVTLLKQGPVSTTELGGLTIYIDRPKGFVQTGKDADGNDWSREYKLDYGFIPRTKGGDGEELDVFLGPAEESSRVFWVTQNKADGSFDEYKLFMGFDTPAQAKAAYVDHIPETYYGGMSEVDIAQVKALLNVEPFALAKRLAYAAVQKVNGISLDEVRRAVNSALVEAYPPGESETTGCYPCGPYVEDLYPTSAIFNHDGKTLSVDYTYEGGMAVLTGEPVAVVRTYVPADQATATAGPKPEAPAGTPVDAEMRAKSVKEYVRATKRAVTPVRVKKDGDEHYVLGVVLEPDIVDLQDDTYSADEVRKASERFMELHRNRGLMHKENINDKVQILENYLAPADFKVGERLVKKGTWLMGVRITDDTLWGEIKAGNLTGFSIGGSAIRTPTNQGV